MGSHDYSNGVAQGRESSRWKDERIAELEAALLAITYRHDGVWFSGIHEDCALPSTARALDKIDAQEKGDG